MSREGMPSGLPLRVIQGGTKTPTLQEALDRLGMDGFGDADIRSLPFTPGDATAGNETELQAAVVGDASCVDLPMSIQSSRCYADILRRAAAGDLRRKAVTNLERWFADNPSGVWENSWVRFPLSCLGPQAREVLEKDLLLDKDDPGRGRRNDTDRFLFHQDGLPFLRVPVSYLLKLALAHTADPSRGAPALAVMEGRRLQAHYLSDNTSPETFSFHVTPLDRETGMGKAMARETAKRFLLTQILVACANERFGLLDRGQQVVVFFSPHPPIRQKRLNACISDAFYRDLFMNPCLSGWRNGESKQAYMHLCHQVLSRSHLNALKKLREAGIVNQNLVILPETSNISLANNGVHISLGSRRFGERLGEGDRETGRACEKYVGDLAVKMVEHFLPLFVGSYSAAPYRLDFTDFHPETALGFLAHELDFTHLRMLWRRWQKKARLKVLGHPVTPFGPPWLDRTLSALLGLQGDFVPDYRLLDYLVALMSTEGSPALNGVLGNQETLKEDLTELGVFDRRMSLYSFLKIREYGVMGFSGFEARHYSLFPSFSDMAMATDLQALLFALAFRYMSRGVDHGQIPDNPFVESERRQVIFGAAVGVPTFFVHQDSPNDFLMGILARTRRIRPSRRYPGYLRVHQEEYRQALVDTIRRDGTDLVAFFGMDDALGDLERRLVLQNEENACERLRRGILQSADIPSPLSLKGDELNRAAETHYRQELRRAHVREAWDWFMEDLPRLEDSAGPERALFREDMRHLTGERDIARFLTLVRKDFLDGQASPDDLETVARLLLLSLRLDRQEGERRLASRVGPGDEETGKTERVQRA